MNVVSRIMEILSQIRRYKLVLFVVQSRCCACFATDII